MPANYSGAIWPAYYDSGVGQHGESDALERSNFTCMLAALGGVSDTVVVVHERHWAVGWIEWIAIHQDDALCAPPTRSWRSSTTTPWSTRSTSPG